MRDSGNPLFGLFVIAIFLTLYLTGTLDKYNVSIGTIIKEVEKFSTRTGEYIQDFFKEKTEKPYKQNIADVIKRNSELADQINYSEIRSSNLSNNEKLVIDLVVEFFVCIVEKMEQIKLKSIFQKWLKNMK